MVLFTALEKHTWYFISTIKPWNNLNSIFLPFSLSVMLGSYKIFWASVSVSPWSRPYVFLTWRLAPYCCWHFYCMISSLSSLHHSSPLVVRVSWWKLLQVKSFCFVSKTKQKQLWKYGSSFILPLRLSSSYFTLHWSYLAARAAQKWKSNSYS